jgi:serpin B
MVVGMMVMAASLTACGGSTVPGPAPDEARSDHGRVSSPVVSADDRLALAQGNAAFAFDLFQQVRGEADNVFFSPYSISAALAMTRAGARGNTASQMDTTLRFGLPQERLNPAFNELDQALASRGQGAHAADGKAFRLHVVNAIWGQHGYQFLAPFLDTLAESFGAGLRLLDFIRDPDGSRGVINAWVADETEDRIQNLLPPRSISEATRLVLTNAIYFNAAWKHAFAPEITRDGTFRTRGGASVTVPMMQQTADLAYVRGDGYQAVELPYEGNEFSMVVVLPDAGRGEDLERSFTSSKVAALVGSLASRHVSLAMPRFGFFQEQQLQETLAGMGMPDAFTFGTADFSGMDGSRNLFISKVIHKAFVKVDEKGTEAAAATAVVMDFGAAPVESVTMVLDRPFLFLIRDMATGAILFLGRVGDPTAA